MYFLVLFNIFFQQSSIYRISFEHYEELQINKTSFKILPKIFLQLEHNISLMKINQMFYLLGYCWIYWSSRFFGTVGISSSSLFDHNNPYVHIEKMLGYSCEHKSYITFVGRENRFIPQYWKYFCELIIVIQYNQAVSNP